MTGKRATMLLLLTAGLAGYPAPGAAWELVTHQRLTEAAINNTLTESTGLVAYLADVRIDKDDQGKKLLFNPTAATKSDFLAGFNNTGTYDGWMIEGAIREDDYTQTPPLLGCTQPQNPLALMDRPLNHFYDVQREGGGLTPCPPGKHCDPAPEWALGLKDWGPGDTSQNHYTILDARVVQFLSLTAPDRGTRDANTALMFRSLGQVLHLLQDMSQPQHTRNDPHAGCNSITAIAGQKSWFEKYIDDRAKGRYGSLLNLSGYPPPTITTYKDLWSYPHNPAGTGLADFSSRNFFSAGTNMSKIPLFNTCGGLSQPQCNPAAYIPGETSYDLLALDGTTHIVGKVKQLIGTVHDPNTNQAIPNVPLSSPSIMNASLQGNNILNLPIYTLNRVNYDAMVDILLPATVGYSTALLDYFFRGSLDFKITLTLYGVVYGNRDQWELSITNTSKTDLMNGSFTLYAEDTAGNRTLVPTDLGDQLAIAAGETRSNISFTPASAVQAFVLVYQGPLGDEPNAVVGKVKPFRVPFAVQQTAEFTGDPDRTDTIYDEPATPSYMEVIGWTQHPGKQKAAGIFVVPGEDTPGKYIQTVEIGGASVQGRLFLNGTDVGQQWDRTTSTALGSATPSTWAIQVDLPGDDLSTIPREIRVVTLDGIVWTTPLIWWRGAVGTASAGSVATFCGVSQCQVASGPETTLGASVFFGDGDAYGSERNDGPMEGQYPLNTDLYPLSPGQTGVSFTPLGSVAGYAVKTIKNPTTSGDTGPPNSQQCWAGSYSGESAYIFADVYTSVTPDHEIVHVPVWRKNSLQTDHTDTTVVVTPQPCTLPPPGPVPDPPTLPQLVFRRDYYPVEQQVFQRLNISVPQNEITLK